MKKTVTGWPGLLFPAQGPTVEYMASMMFWDSQNLKLPDPYDPKFLTQDFFEALAGPP